MQTIGSQIRETLPESGMLLIKKCGDDAYLKEINIGKIELWTMNDHYSGYVIEIDGDGYEFVRSIAEYES